MECISGWRISVLIFWGLHVMAALCSAFVRNEQRIMKRSSLTTAFLYPNSRCHLQNSRNAFRGPRILPAASTKGDDSTQKRPYSGPSLSLEKSISGEVAKGEGSFRQRRIDALHEQLRILGIDAKHLAAAANKSMTTTEGYDGHFGKSAIKAYRTYVDPRPSKSDTVKSEDVTVAATRCARQIDFLAKRHRSHAADWVRHTDTVDGTSDPRKSFPLTIVLDNVRSAFNVGSIFRTADACACTEIITTGLTPHPNGSGAEKLAKSALGADRIVPTRHFSTTQLAVDFLRSERPGVMLVGMETTDLSKCYTDVSYPDGSSGGSNNGVALVLGNEVTGVDTQIMPLLDEIVEIPMFGAKNSLNIAACAPVVMYEILRQWGAMDLTQGMDRLKDDA